MEMDLMSSHLNGADEVEPNNVNNQKNHSETYFILRNKELAWQSEQNVIALRLLEAARHISANIIPNVVLGRKSYLPCLKSIQVPGKIIEECNKMILNLNSDRYTPPTQASANMNINTDGITNTCTQQYKEASNVYDGMATPVYC
ncbi:hypothetical protein HELRODRAFT_166060 [Helobdella robusta]|uniref:Uncharacterized protein n=1 Tax=Helobdella robusta TaxID=6412 RepID=T1EXN7_HELRO|nr:hypothetical protein HELRODRAFT_166060 [Helobdella robusta]ESN90395.1 hypothetical protein HELRODRAFT_166060 [Helobdella robusta]